MTGLSVLYAREAAEERDWAAIPDRDRTGRLREVYWARRADSKSGRKPFVNMKLSRRSDRSEIGRGRNDPGDEFIYVVNMVPGVEGRFEWLEVTEVFTTVPASQIEGCDAGMERDPGQASGGFRRIPKGLESGTTLEGRAEESRRSGDRADREEGGQGFLR